MEYDFSSANAVPARGVSMAEFVQANAGQQRYGVRQSVGCKACGPPQYYRQSEKGQSDVDSKSNTSYPAEPK
jgi:hypothetical protein